MAIRRVSLLFLVVACGVVCLPSTAAAAPACNERAAKRAVVTTAMAQRMRQTFGKGYFGGKKVMEIFGVGFLSCRDLTGDSQREMTVGLGCCTVGAPDPWAIFMRDGERWRLAFTRINVGVFGLRTGIFEDFADGTDKPAVEEKAPVYADGDPNCCPSSYRYRYTAWNGTRFVYGAR